MGEASICPPHSTHQVPPHMHPTAKHSVLDNKLVFEKVKWVVMFGYVLITFTSHYQPK